MRKKGASIGFTITQIPATLIVVFILIIFLGFTSVFVLTNSVKDISLNLLDSKNPDFGNYEYSKIDLKTQEVLLGILNYHLENKNKLSAEILEYSLSGNKNPEEIRDKIRETANKVLKKDYLIKIYFLEYVSDEGNKEEVIYVSNLDEKGIDSTIKFGDLNSAFYDIGENSFYYGKKGVKVQLFIKK
ncbi:hypothetical protein K9M16_05035 [Candidatus Babeliales bacterium]|nr:hypothetical protein [Candidatus Babeliales bacterium]